jgi:hypothetical protein
VTAAAALSLFLLASPAAAAEPGSLEDLRERLSRLEAAQKSPAANGSGGPHWYDRVSLRGYMQLRYNRFFENNQRLTCESCDRSLGSNQGLFFRRARLTLNADVHERVLFVSQSDLASDASPTSQYFLQTRDLYADIALDDAKTLRVRPGASKVPFGFENMQSSQVRATLDRADSLNSGVPNERDLGVFVYWAPAHIRKRLSHLASELKGSGDFGVLALGAYNGQSPNRPEANDSQHLVARAAWPFQTAGGKYWEAGVQGYAGRFVLPNRTAGVSRAADEFHDKRVAGTFVVYPQPVGLQAEYVYGVGPEYEASSRSVRRKHLRGGYVQTVARVPFKSQLFWPFARVQYYEGGKKTEQDARRYLVRQAEAGFEWHPVKRLEFTVAYSLEDRAYEDDGTRGNRQKGGRLRLMFEAGF